MFHNEIGWNCKMNVGDIVYRYEHWADFIEKAKILEIEGNVAKIKSICMVSYDDEPIANTYGQCYEITDDLFNSAKEAYDTYYLKQSKQIKNYCEEIHTVEDLINFPLNHCISNGEEYTNNEAPKLILIWRKNCLK